MLIKICGLTRQQDADLAVALGAGALGFVFWPKSPRCIDPDRARAIVASLPAFVTPVGVFVNQSAHEVNDLADRVGLGAVQLHGDETVSALAEIGRPVVKAVTIGTAEAAARIWPDRVTLLIDAHDPGRRGGTGLVADWDVAARLAARRRTLLAGGLTATNVAEAILRVAPFGIDVSSGVESAPGIKDHDRLRAFFEAAASVAARQWR